MRTVDPELWYRTVKKPRIQMTRTMRFGMKPPTSFEDLVRASFVDAVKEFRSNCSVRAINRIDNVADQCQKNAYRLMLAIVLCVGLCVVGYNLYQLGKVSPLLINLLPNPRSVHYIQFPAVGLCSNNVFSSKALQKFIAYLDSKDQNSTYTEEEIKKHLMKFGALLTLMAPPVDVMFINFLNAKQPNFNVTELMFKLSPKCSSVLRRCTWSGQLQPCDSLFASRITPLGFCCVFNSRYQPEDVSTPPKLLDVTGQDFGLSFLIKNTDDEFIYARRPREGYEVMLFEGSEYPLIEGGGVRLYPVQQNASLFMAISVREEQSSHSLNYYNEIWRGCRLRDMSTSKSWRSSYGWCLTACRRRSIAALCRCHLYTLPPDNDYMPLCTTNDLSCLNKHREKFMYYYPGETSEPSLCEELQDAQECQHCTPDCARLAYSATVAYKHYVTGEAFYQNYISKGVSLVNASVVRIFYTSWHQEQYSVESNLRWYESIALVASQWVSVLGVTILFVTELVFFINYRWPHHYMRRARAARQINAYNDC